MFLTKLKIMSMVLLAMAMAAGGAGGLAYYAQASEPAIQQAEAEPKNKKAEQPEVAQAEVQADVEALKQLDRLKVAEAKVEVAQADVEQANAILQAAQAKVVLATKNRDEVRAAYERTKGQLEKLNWQKKAKAKAVQADDEERNRRDEERKDEQAKLRDLFHNGNVDVFIDGDTQKPSIKGARFHSIVELSGRKFLRFSRLGSDGREERLLIDPARIVSVRIPE